MSIPDVYNRVGGYVFEWKEEQIKIEVPELKHQVTAL